MAGNCSDGLGCVGKKEGANKAYTVRVGIAVAIRSCRPNHDKHKNLESRPKQYPSSHRLFRDKRPQFQRERVWALSNHSDQRKQFGLLECVSSWKCGMAGVHKSLQEQG